MNQEGMLRLSRRRIVRQRALPAGSALFLRVMEAFRREASRLGIELSPEAPEQTARVRRIDPVSGDETLVCRWGDPWGAPAGTLVVNPDGSFYAEQEVFQPPLSASSRGVRSFRAWGWSPTGEVHCESRLLPAL